MEKKFRYNKHYDSESSATSVRYNSLKREINNYPSTKDFETLRKRVKNDELAAEQIQQEIIQSKIETRELKFQPFSRSDAMKHLAYYLKEELYISLKTKEYMTCLPKKCVMFERRNPAKKKQAI